MKRYAITGPESSGKTTLTFALAKQYNCSFTPEFAREFLMAQKGIYSKEDLDLIAKGQLELWGKHSNKPLLFCDTEMLVLKIWSEFKYDSCSKFISEALDQQQFDHYFLCRPDIPWIEDPLREHPEQREELFILYEKELQKRNLPYTIVEGDLENRLKICNEIISVCP